MRLVKSFLFAAVVAATIALPSDRASAFLMDGVGGPGPFIVVSASGIAPLIVGDGFAPDSFAREVTNYTTKPGDKLRTKDGRGVLDRFGVSVNALRDANPDALVPVCVGAFLNPNGLVTCRDLNWYLRERVTLTIPPR